MAYDEDLLDRACLQVRWRGSWIICLRTGTTDRAKSTTVLQPRHGDAEFVR